MRVSISLWLVLMFLAISYPLYALAPGSSMPDGLPTIQEKSQILDQLSKVIFSIQEDQSGNTTELYQQLNRLIRQLNPSYLSEDKMISRVNLRILRNYHSGLIDIFLQIPDVNKVMLFRFYARGTIPKEILDVRREGDKANTFYGTAINIKKGKIDDQNRYLIFEMTPNDSINSVDLFPENRVQSSTNQLMNQLIGDMFFHHPQKDNPETGSASKRESTAFLKDLMRSSQQGGEHLFSTDELGQIGMTEQQLYSMLAKVLNDVQMVFIDPKNKSDLFLGLYFDTEDHFAFAHAGYGVNHDTPTVYLNDNLRSFLKRSIYGADQSEALAFITAIRLNLSLKLLFYHMPLTEGMKETIDQLALKIQKEYFYKKGFIKSKDESDPLLDFVEKRVKNYQEYRMRIFQRGADGRIEGWKTMSRTLYKVLKKVYSDMNNRFNEKYRLLPAPVFKAMRDYWEWLSRKLLSSGNTLSAEAIDSFKDRNMTILYANLVRDPQTGEGALIFGEPRSGKSYITAALSLSGIDGKINSYPWDFISDDRVLVMVLPEDPDNGLPSQILAMASPLHDDSVTELKYRTLDGVMIRPGKKPVGEFVPIRHIFLIHEGNRKRALTTRQAIEDLQSGVEESEGVVLSSELRHLLLYSSVPVHSLPIPEKGVEGFHGIADIIRKIMNSTSTRKFHYPVERKRINEFDSSYFIWPDSIVSDSGNLTNVLKVAVSYDGYDTEYSIYPDGTVKVKLQSIGKEFDFKEILEMDSRIDLSLYQLPILKGFTMVLFEFNSFTDSESGQTYVKNDNDPTRAYPVNRWMSDPNSQPDLHLPGFNDQVVKYLFLRMLQDHEHWNGWLDNYKKWVSPMIETQIQAEVLGGNNEHLPILEFIRKRNDEMVQAPLFPHLGDKEKIQASA